MQSNNKKKRKKPIEINSDTEEDNEKSNGKENKIPKLDDLEYRERDLALKERELALREREAKIRVIELSNLERERQLKLIN